MTKQAAYAKVHPGVPARTLVVVKARRGADRVAACTSVLPSLGVKLCSTVAHLRVRVKRNEGKPLDPQIAVTRFRSSAMLGSSFCRGTTCTDAQIVRHRA
jgi:hypothetical protein